MSNKNQIKKIKLKNGQIRWEFQVYLGVNPKTGKQATTQKRYETYREADLQLSRIKAQVKEGTYFKKKKKKTSYTFKEVYEIWFDSYQHTVEESSLLKIEGDFERRILPAIGHYRIDKIEHGDIQSLANEWGDFVNCSNWISSIRRMFTYANTPPLELNIKDPTANVVIPTPKRKKRDKIFFEKEELKKFIDVLSEEKNLQKIVALRLLIFCGIRRGETLGLYWDCVDFDEKTIQIKRAVKRRKKKKDDGKKSKTELYIGAPKNEASYRTLSVDDITLSYLRKLKEHKINERIFNSKNGGIMTVSNPRKWMIDIIDKAGLERINIHGLRHTHTSLLIDAGATIKDVQKRLGHNDLDTTLEIYAHVTEHSEKKLAKTFSDYIDF